MGKSGRKRIGKNKKDVSKNVQRGTDPNTSESPLTFDLSNKDWLRSISKKGYTNKLKDETMFATYIFELFHKVIPVIQENWKSIIKSGGTGAWPHCHPIAEDKLDEVVTIIENIHGHKFSDGKVAGPSLWQFGITQNIRLIAIRDYTNNCLTPVFVDYHHLIHESEHHNQADYNRYDFCPYCEYGE